MTNEAELAGLTEVQRELFEAACAVRPCDLSEILEPDWSDLPDFNWRIYVDEASYQWWEELPLEAKLIEYARAAEKAKLSKSYDPPE